MKVSDLAKASDFWRQFLGVTPHKAFDTWHEFMCGDIRFGLLLNNFNDVFQGSGCVPVFEYAAAELRGRAEHAMSLGAQIVVDKLDDPSMGIIVLRCPQGHEFELCGPHP